MFVVSGVLIEPFKPEVATINMFVCEIWETNNCEAASVGMSVYERNIWPWPSLSLYSYYESLNVIVPFMRMKSNHKYVSVRDWWIVCYDFSAITIENVWLYLLWLLVAVTTLFGSGISCTSCERWWGIYIYNASYTSFHISFVKIYLFP